MVNWIAGSGRLAIPKARDPSADTSTTTSGARRRQTSGTTWTATSAHPHHVMRSLGSSASATVIEMTVTTPTAEASRGVDGQRRELPAPLGEAGDGGHRRHGTDAPTGRHQTTV